MAAPLSPRGKGSAVPAVRPKNPAVPAEARSFPRYVFLFSGHMIDAPARPEPRFPADKAAVAACAIAEALDALDAGPEDLALAQGASGGDLLFLEACRERGVRFRMLLPLPEAEFIEQSILPSKDGERWRDRYFAIKSAAEEPPRVMPDNLGVLPGKENGERADPFEECNLWLLSTAIAYGAEKLHFIGLWDGGGGDGPGGTAHMMEEVKRAGGKAVWIDTRRLW